jgi:peptidyl-tRNA hydrolase ICT1
MKMLVPAELAIMWELFQTWRLHRTRNVRLNGLIKNALGSRRWATDRRGAEIDDEELKAARYWLTKLDAETIPRSICEVSFSRSSGPGGQHVNK